MNAAKKSDWNDSTKEGASPREASDTLWSRRRANGHSHGETRQRLLGQTSASAIMIKVLPPVRYVVEGYIAEGVTVLAGRPKFGKSWLALGIGVGVSMGGYALNTRVEQGDVLYLALEDNERRMQKRLKQLLPPSSTTPSRLFIDFTCPRMDQGGLDAIREWIVSVEKPRLIVVDVFGKIRPLLTGKEQIYSSDYDSITPLKEIASEHGIAIFWSTTPGNKRRRIPSIRSAAQLALLAPLTPFWFWHETVRAPRCTVVVATSKNLRRPCRSTGRQGIGEFLEPPLRFGGLTSARQFLAHYKKPTSQ